MTKNSTKLRILLLGFLLYFLASPGCVYAQGGTVRGKVSAETGEALPGVNVVVKGSSRGTTSDIDGSYVLEGVKPEDVLIFSFIGYTAQEITAGQRTSIDVVLGADIETLGEVVVVGYGTQRKIETTGSIASVKSDDIVQTPVTNVAQGLQARVAGVQVTHRTRQRQAET